MRKSNWIKNKPHKIGGGKVNIPKKNICWISFTHFAHWINHRRMQPQCMDPVKGDPVGPNGMGRFVTRGLFVFNPMNISPFRDPPKKRFLSCQIDFLRNWVERYNIYIYNIYIHMYGYIYINIRICMCMYILYIDMSESYYESLKINIKISLLDFVLRKMWPPEFQMFISLGSGIPNRKVYLPLASWEEEHCKILSSITNHDKTTPALRIMESHNWWFGDPNKQLLLHIQTPLFWRVQWFFQWLFLVPLIGGR